MGNNTTFAGWKPGNLSQWQDAFDIEYSDDGYLYLVSKKQYEHEAEENLLPHFTYHYYLEAVDMLRATADESQARVILQLYMAPDARYWHASKVKDVMKANGWEDWEPDDVRKAVTCQDAIEAGCVIPFLRDIVEYDATEYDEGFYDILDCQEAKAKLDAAAACLEAFDSLSGFQMDAAKNRIGTTGWEILEATLNGTDPYQPALDRILKGGGV